MPAAKIGVIPEEYADILAAPHVVYALLAKLDFDSGTMRLHSGPGNIVAGGHTWRGVTDPERTRVVSLGEIQLPEVNIASAIPITLSGADIEVLRLLRSEAGEAEGRPATLYFLPYDTRDNLPACDPIPFFRDGTMTAPTINWDGPGRRSITLTIEGIYSAKNFTIGGKVNGTDQRRRFPGDKGCDFVGSRLSYVWPRRLEE